MDPALRKTREASGKICSSEDERVFFIEGSPVVSSSFAQCSLFKIQTPGISSKDTPGALEGTKVHAGLGRLEGTRIALEQHSRGWYSFLALS